MAIGPSLRATLASYVPTWLGNVPGLRNLFSLLWTTALVGDALREIAWQGQLAAYPGVGTATALPYIGASRGRVQGPSEPDDVFALRCRNWLTDVQKMGNTQGLVLEVQAYLVGQGSLGLGVYPVVRFIDRRGHTTTANADRTVTESLGSWSWDDVDGWIDGVGFHWPDELADWWSDGWLIIEDPYTHYTGFADANWLAAWNTGDQTVDSLTPQSVVAALSAIIDTWKGCHTYVRCVVWTANPAAFVPDGTYGNWSSNQSGTQSATRDDANSYWQPVDGA